MLKRGHKRIGLVISDDWLGTAARGAVQKAAHEMQMSLAAEGLIEARSTDARKAVAKIAAAKVDAILIWTQIQRVPGPATRAAQE